jgi:hypothetical protein
MSNQDFFQRVKVLRFPLGSYALFGSAPMGIRGLKECHDIDMIVTEDLWNACKNKNWEQRTNQNGITCLWNNEIELWKEWGPGTWDIKKLIEEAELIDDLPFVRLETVLDWKKKNGRPKDLNDIKTIEAFLQTSK